MKNERFWNVWRYLEVYLKEQTQDLNKRREVCAREKKKIKKVEKNQKIIIEKLGAF